MNFYTREKMEQAKMLLAGLFAIGDLDFQVGIYDDETRKLKLINNIDNKPKLRIVIFEYEDICKMGIQLKFKEKHIITAEEDEKLHMEHIKNCNKNPLTT